MHCPGLKQDLYDSSMRLGAGPSHSIPGFRRGTVLVAARADNLVAEDDGDLAFLRPAFDRFEPRLPRILCVEPGNVVFDPAHQKEQSKDCEGPRDEDYQQEYLIGSHIRKCRRP